MDTAKIKNPTPNATNAAPNAAPPVAPTPDHAKQSADTFSTPAPEHASATEQSNHEGIAQRAYDIYLQSGSQPNRCAENWKRAEQALHDQNHPDNNPDNRAQAQAKAKTPARPAPNYLDQDIDRHLEEHDIQTDEHNPSPQGRNNRSQEPGRSSD